VLLHLRRQRCWSERRRERLQPAPWAPRLAARRMGGYRRRRSTPRCQWPQTPAGVGDESAEERPIRDCRAWVPCSPVQVKQLMKSCGQCPDGGIRRAEIVTSFDAPPIQSSRRPQVFVKSVNHCLDGLSTSTTSKSDHGLNSRLDPHSCQVSVPVALVERPTLADSSRPRRPGGTRAAEPEPSRRAPP
jgi:hypothetical protein